VPNNEWARTKVFYFELLIHVIESPGPPASGAAVRVSDGTVRLGFSSRRTVFYHSNSNVGFPRVRHIGKVMFDLDLSAKLQKWLR